MNFLKTHNKCKNTQKTPNTTTQNPTIMQAKSAELRKKTQKLTKPKPVVIYKNCSYVCTYNCAYTVCTQYNTKSSHNLSDISPLIIQSSSFRCCLLGILSIICSMS